MANFTDLGPNSIDNVNVRTAQQQTLAQQKEALLEEKRKRREMARRTRNQRIDFETPEDEADA